MLDAGHSDFFFCIDNYRVGMPVENCNGMNKLKKVPWKHSSVFLARNNRNFDSMENPVSAINYLFSENERVLFSENESVLENTA